MAKFLFLDDKIINILLKDDKPSGGAAVQAYGWIRGLSESGHVIHILTTKHHNEELKDECKKLNLIPLYNKQKGIRWVRWVYYRIPYLYNKIRKVKPDFLYQGVPGWSSFFIGMICIQLNIKYILRISNDFLIDDRFYKNYSKTHRLFQDLGFKLSDYILCQNDYQFGVIQKKFPEKKVFKISNPVLWNAKEKIPGISNDYIAWLGLYQYQKNIKLLYEIALRLESEQFLIAGKEENKCDNETLAYLDKLKILPNVQLVGYLSRDQITPFLSKAKFLLNTSHYEGFSNTFLEAMSTGTPILTSQKVNPDNIISEYNLGIVYTDVNDLYSKYFSITSQSYSLMSKNVITYVDEKHNYKKLTKKLLECLTSEKIDSKRVN